MPHFRDWTLQDARTAIDNAIEETVGAEGFEANAAYAEDHDHWQEGAPWPGGGAVGSEVRTRVLAGVEPQFVPNDVIGEVLDRRSNALMQREPDVVLQPLVPAAEGSAEEAAQKAEAAKYQAALSTWWDRVKFWEKSRSALKRVGWSGRGGLRPWLPSGRLIAATDSEGRDVRVPPSGLTFEAALETIALDAPLPDALVVVTDPDTQERAAVVLFEEQVDNNGTPVPKTWAELWFTDGDTTVQRILTDGEDAPQEHRYEMGRRLPVNEMAADALITEPIRRQQARLNFFESILNRLGETASFPERYITDAEPFGIYTLTPPGDGESILKEVQFRGQTFYLRAMPRTLGAAITTELHGTDLGIATDGTRRIATPTVTKFDPTDPEYAIKGARHGRRTILDQCKQGHVVMDGTAEASGTAYQQARADHEADLNGVKPPLEGLIRDTLEGVIVLAESMMTVKPKILERFRIAVNLHVSSGPITTIEREQNNNDVKAGTLGRESAMAKNGVEDVGAELLRMGNQPESVIELRRKQIDAVQVLHGESMTWLRAAKISGIVDPELLKIFTEQDTEDATKPKQEDAQDRDIDDALKVPKVEAA